ncbi:adenylate/guanylate cyclase domain-containing protein [Rariglobus hedericola]|nr:adenylate/guanylate cyclase domain-containing protein [Rariglobus hedericola]
MDSLAHLTAPDARQSFIKLPWWRRFDFRIAAILVGTSSVIIVLVGLFAYQSIVNTRLDLFEKRLRMIAVTLSETINTDELASVPASADQHTPVIASLWRRLKNIADAEPGIESIYILQATETPGKLRFLLDASKVSRIAQTGELYDATELPFMLQGFERVSVEDRVYGDDFGQTQSSYAPLKTSDGRVIGIIGVDVLALRLAEIRWQVVRFCAAVFGIAFIAVLVITMVVRRQVRQPLARVLEAASAIAAGKLDTRLHAPSRDEFGLLADEFDTMASHLRDRERLRETFGLYVSRELASALMKDGKLPALGGVECVATVIFCDLGNYTRISEAFSPQEVISLINEYLAAMCTIIEAHRGCLLDFTGDGIIAGFGLPLPDPDHAHNAVQCAIKMRQRLTQLNGEWEARGLAARWQVIGVDRIEARMGIHTGPLVAGNIGSSSRMKYCVMGDTVNIAARLEEMNKDFNSTILLSDQVKIRVPSAMTDTFADYGVVNIRGRVQAVGAYSV